MRQMSHIPNAMTSLAPSRSGPRPPNPYQREPSTGLNYEEQACRPTRSSPVRCRVTSPCRAQPRIMPAGRRRKKLCARTSGHSVNGRRIPDTRRRSQAPRITCYRDNTPPRGADIPTSRCRQIQPNRSRAQQNYFPTLLVGLIVFWNDVSWRTQLNAESSVQRALTPRDVSKSGRNSLSTIYGFMISGGMWAALMEYMSH